MMKVTLQIGGREMTFSESELTEILENHFANQKEICEKQEAETVERPIEGKCFYVNPEAISKKRFTLFSQERKDPIQEWTRQIILEAFIMVNVKPEKYAKSFKTMMPKKTWETKTVGELEELASNIGDHIADWVEQALEWAQRILNGESWESLCNQLDTANWYRLVVWKTNFPHIVGGSKLKNYRNESAVYVEEARCFSDKQIGHTVPLVVLYD